MKRANGQVAAAGPPPTAPRRRGPTGPSRRPLRARGARRAHGRRSGRLRGRRHPLDRARARRSAGVRLWHYAATVDGDPRRAPAGAGMTYKAAAAGLDLGGGKGVICAPAGAPPAGERAPCAAARLRRPGRVARRPLHHRRGRRHRRRGHGGDRASGPARDRAAADHGGSGDPSPFTALGVEAAMRACARRALRLDRTFAAARSRSQGSATSATTWRGGSPTPAPSWRSPTSTRRKRERSHASSAPHGSSPTTRAPDRVRRVRALRARRRDRREPTCRALRCADRLRRAPTTSSPTRARRTTSPSAGILYAPDYIVNAGGLIHVYREIRGYSEHEATPARARHRGQSRTASSRRPASARSRRCAPRASSPRSASTRRAGSRQPPHETLRLRGRALDRPGRRVALRGGARRRRSAWRPRGRPARSPTCCCCSSTRPSTRKGRRSDPRRAADGRGLVPDAGDRGARDRPRRAGHLPRPRPAGRPTRSSTCGRYGDDVHEYVRAHGAGR